MHHSLNYINHSMLKEARFMSNYNRRLRNSGIHWPCSISVVAREVYDTTWPILKRILRDQGRFYGRGNTFITTDEYRQYEHCTNDGRGEKYDLEFFDGLIVTQERIEAATEEMRADRAYEAEEKSRRARQVEQDYINSRARTNSRPSGSEKSDVLLSSLMRLFGKR